MYIQIKKAGAGFTMVELVVVVAILGILGALAYSSYMSSSLKSGRAEAKAELHDVAQRLQRCFTTNNAYNAPACGVVVQLAGGITSRNNLYVVRPTALTATTFTLTAAPRAGGRQEQDSRCTTFTLTHTGVQGATGSAAAECW